MNAPDGAGLILDWVRSHSRNVAADEIDIDTPLIRRGVISSLQLSELILFIEQAAGRRIDPARLVPGTFHSVATIAASFFETATDDADVHDC